MEPAKVLIEIYLRNLNCRLSKYRRLRTIAVETFKLIHKQSTSYLHDLISIKDQNIKLGIKIKQFYPKYAQQALCRFVFGLMLHKSGMSCLITSDKKHH